MSEREQCGDFEIYLDNEDWWVIKNSISGTILGKFLKKEDALDKIAAFLQSDEERTESESVC
ncbi:MAG: hypothetical protein GPJ51_04685 [Candidatus Heimdallarchaeota archaeon]|nr:hypothetical protein [Candidatus Heimdallarchaeota archaeon]